MQVELAHQIGSVSFAVLTLRLANRRWLGGSGHSSLWHSTEFRHLDLDDVVLDGVHNQIADRVQIELSHNVAAMCFHGFCAQVQEYGHFLGALSFSKKLSDFTFTGSQRWQIRRFIPGYGMSFL